MDPVPYKATKETENKGEDTRDTSTLEFKEEAIEEQDSRETFNSVCLEEKVEIRHSKDKSRRKDKRELQQTLKAK